MCWDTAYSTPDNTCTVVLGQSFCGIATLVAAFEVAAFDPDASVTLANLRYRLRSQRHRVGVRSAGHSLAPVLSVCPSSCLGGGPTACAVRSAPSELVVPQYLPSLVPPGVVDICDYELKLPVMHRLPDPRRATTNANGITVRSPIGSSKNAANLGGKDEPGLNGASSCVRRCSAGGLR
jgi:hypothetical protein